MVIGLERVIVPSHSNLMWLAPIASSRLASVQLVTVAAGAGAAQDKAAMQWSSGRSWSRQVFIGPHGKSGSVAWFFSAPGNLVTFTRLFLHFKCRAWSEFRREISLRPENRSCLTSQHECRTKPNSLP